MVPVILLVVGIGIPLLILIVLLALFLVPVIAGITLGKTPERGYLLFQASWGWIGARRRMEAGESRQEILLGGHLVYTRTEKAGEARKPEANETPPEAHSLLSRIPRLLRLVRPLTSLAGTFLRHTSFRELRGRLKIGFPDPALTGMLYGWYWAIRPSLAGSRVSLDMTPVFDRQVLEGEIMAEVRIDRPLLLLLAVAGLLLDRDVRDALSGLREG